MRMCQPHWDALRAAIHAHGLSKFVAGSGQEIAERVVSGGSDPLMDAHNLILGNALETGGLAVMADNDDGTERCPVCFLNAPEWIKYAADGVAESYAALRDAVAQPPEEGK